ncbi:hypothetical protein BB560_007051 [Smittium megazygosporum]|uniref:FAD/NAD(P)-binding domain-containing protein n=1 Tax=Smittium megazygosporum TaxID=133381 RepID=A0A2T9XZ33_9FUNG|nr:hypothetical protein BB560_007051 [Smittium megazygosporum]
MKFDDQCASFPAKKNSNKKEESLFEFLSSENSPSPGNGSNFRKKKPNRLEKLFGKSKSNKSLGSKEIEGRMEYSPSINRSVMSYVPSVYTSQSGNVSEHTSMASLKVLVIGGSAAGLYFTKILEKLCKKRVKITIIEPNTKIFFKSAAFSSVMDYTTSKDLFIPLEKIFHYSHNSIVHSKAVSVTDEYVETEDGKTIYYDVLVVASGSTYPIPCKMEGRDIIQTEAVFNDYFKKTIAAKNAVIIGGGPCGTELALRMLKEKAVENLTIVHDEPMLLNENYPESYRNKIQSKIISQGGNLILSDTAKLSPEKDYGYPIKGRWVSTESGKMFFTDIQFNCTGPIANSDFLKHLDQSKHKIIDSEKGFIRVNRYLQIIGYDKIFAIGDVNNINGIKSIQRAKDQAETVAYTIFTWINKKNEETTISHIQPKTWPIDCNQAYISIKNNEFDEVKIDPKYDSGLLNEAIVKKNAPEIQTRKVDLLKNQYKLMGFVFKGAGSY